MIMITSPTRRGRGEKGEERGEKPKWWWQWWNHLRQHKKRVGENPRERTEMQERKRNKEENLPEIGGARDSNAKNLRKRTKGERLVSLMFVLFCPG